MVKFFEETVKDVILTPYVFLRLRIKYFISLLGPSVSRRMMHVMLVHPKHPIHAEGAVCYPPSHSVVDKGTGETKTVMSVVGEETLLHDKGSE